MKIVSVAALGFLLSAGGATAAPQLSGFWQLVPGKHAAPVLTPWARAQMRKTPHVGDIDATAAKWCVQQGLPHVMDSAGPIDIIQGPSELVVMAERIAIPRHIYVGGKHPPEDTFDHTPVGSSTAQDAGDALIVDTVGFDDGVGPQGAPRTQGAHLVERFTRAGDTLRVQSTWTDSKVFTRPYSYTLTYRMLPKGYTAEEAYCDPRANGVSHPAS